MNQNNSILLYSRGWLCSWATLSQHFSVQLWLMKDWIPDEWITLTGVYPRQVNSVCAPCEAESNRGLALSAPGLNLHANIQQPDRPCQSAFMGRGVQKPYWPWYSLNEPDQSYRIQFCEERRAAHQATCICEISSPKPFTSQDHVISIEKVVWSESAKLMSLWASSCGLYKWGDYQTTVT